MSDGKGGNMSSGLKAPHTDRHEHQAYVKKLLQSQLAKQATKKPGEKA